MLEARPCAVTFRPVPLLSDNIHKLLGSLKVMTWRIIGLYHF